MNRSVPVLLLVSAFVVLAGCNLFPSAQIARPPVVVVTPPSGSQVQFGDDVAIQSTSTDAAGVVHVELFVDGNLVRSDAPPGGQSQTQFKVIQTWKATTSGAHTLTVRATNVNGAVGEAAITVNVQEQAAQNLTVTPVGIIPTATSGAPSDTVAAPTATNTTAPAASDTPTTAPPTATNTSAPPPLCTNNSQFIADVTIPDGTVVAAGSAFVKTWRVLNSGSCAWTTAYAIVRIGGEQMGAASPGPIPAAAPGAVVDISLPMLAPTSPGAHSGTWGLRGPDGIFFGTNLTVVISVPGPPTATLPPATSTGTPTRTPSFTPTHTRTPTLVLTVTTSVAGSQVAASVNIAAQASGSVAAECPAGTRVTGGGYGIGSNPMLLLANSSMIGNAWRVVASNSSGSNGQLIAYAICVSGLSGTTTQVGKQISIAGGTFAGNTVACPSGSTVTGGGFSQNNVVVYLTEQNLNGWTTSARNYGGSSGLLNTYAICYNNGTGPNSFSVLAQVVVPAFGEGQAAAECPQGSLVTGGGFTINPEGNGRVYTMLKIGNAWRAVLKNLPTGASSVLSVYAACMNL